MNPYEVKSHSQPLAIGFVGPFSWPGIPGAPSIFDSDRGKESGIYLWAVRQPEGYLVYYVGETGRPFGVRMREHYEQHAACFYHVYSPAEFARGQKVLLWPGRFDSAQKRSVVQCIAEYGRLATPVAELTSLYRFLLAPLSVDKRTRRRIEAALAQHLYSQPGVPGGFQDRGIRYSPRQADEQPVLCKFSSSVPVIGLPTQMWA